MDSIPLKRCPRCGRDLPLTEFQKNQKRRDGLQERCKDCRREHYYDPDRLAHKREYDQERRAEIGDELNARKVERYHSDEEYRERYKQTERERSKTPQARAYDNMRYERDRKGNPEYIKKRVDHARNRRHNDPEYRVKLSHWRRARQARIEIQGTPFTHAEWVALCERYDHRCLCCGERKPLTVDHVVPISRGGSSDISNIQPLCIDCNKRKHARTIDYRY